MENKKLNLPIADFNLLNFSPSDENKRLTSIDWNTLSIFQIIKLGQFGTSIYLACKIIGQDITIDRLIEILKTIEKYKRFNKETIQKTLNKLEKLGYIFSGAKKTDHYFIKSESDSNQKLIQKIKDSGQHFENFYDSKIILTEKSIKYYKEQSKRKFLKYFIFSEIIPRYFFEVTTTNNQINDIFHLSRRELDRLEDLETEQVHLKKYENQKDSAFYNIKSNYAVIGKKYSKKIYATQIKLTKKLQETITFNDQNILDENKEVINHTEKISLIRKEKGIKGVLSDRELIATNPCFFAEMKREVFLPFLSNNLVINDLKRRKNKIYRSVRDDENSFLFNAPKKLYYHPLK